MGWSFSWSRFWFSDLEAGFVPVLREQNQWVLFGEMCCLRTAPYYWFKPLNWRFSDCAQRRAINVDYCRVKSLESHHITHHDHEVVDFFPIVPWTDERHKFYGTPLNVWNSTVTLRPIVVNVAAGRNQSATNSSSLSFSFPDFCPCFFTFLLRATLPYLISL